MNRADMADDDKTEGVPRTRGDEPQFLMIRPLIESRSPYSRG